MKIETKFNLGDTIWEYDGSYTRGAKIAKIIIGAKDIAYETERQGCRGCFLIGECHAFATEEEARAAYTARRRSELEAELAALDKE